MYFSKMRRFAEEMAAAGKQLDDDDIVSYILNGLDVEYNPSVEQVTGMSDSISLDELYTRLLSRSTPGVTVPDGGKHCCTWTWWWLQAGKSWTG
jgi:excinuclease UvrABC ATPase subunit